MKNTIAYKVLDNGSIMRCEGCFFILPFNNPNKDEFFGFTKEGLDYYWRVKQNNIDVSSESLLFFDKASAQVAAEEVVLSIIKNYLNFDKKTASFLQNQLVDKINNIT